VAEAGRNFARHSPQRQHRIRLQAKTVRYAIDCLAPVLPRRLSGAVRRALARFQDAAGRAQDATVALEAVGRLTRSAALHGDLAAWAAKRRSKPAHKAQRLAARLSA
jgi:CHAD domain-containing protein